MTAPEPALPPVQAPRDRLTDRLLSYGLTRAQVAIILADADEYAMHMVEVYARPDERWGPG